MAEEHHRGRTRRQPQLTIDLRRLPIDRRDYNEPLTGEHPGIHPASRRPEHTSAAPAREGNLEPAQR